MNEREIEDIRKEIEALNLSDLRYKKLCFFCLASGISIESALHNWDELMDGPITSDSKCRHCYDTEEEYGRPNFTKRQRVYASKVLEIFDEYRNRPR